jgi:secreted trypsin-like serine protease
MVGPLAMGATATFVVTVHIPRFAQNGESDTVQITITSIGDPTKKAITSVTTNIHVSTYYIYLPLVRKGP